MQANSAARKQAAPVPEMGCVISCLPQWPDTALTRASAVTKIAAVHRGRLVRRASPPQADAPSIRAPTEGVLNALRIREELMSTSTRHVIGNLEPHGHDHALIRITEVAAEMVPDEETARGTQLAGNPRLSLPASRAWPDGARGLLYAGAY